MAPKPSKATSKFCHFVLNVMHLDLMAELANCPQPEETTHSESAAPTTRNLQIDLGIGQSCDWGTTRVPKLDTSLCVTMSTVTVDLVDSQSCNFHCEPPHGNANTRTIVPSTTINHMIVKLRPKAALCPKTIHVLYSSMLSHQYCRAHWGNK